MIAKVLGYQGIPTTRTVREHAASLALDLWLPWKDDRDNEWSFEHIPPERRRERTVVDPIYVVPQMLPCPECRGTGVESVGPSGFVPDMPSPCEPCGGSGVVAPPWPDYIATEQQRISIGMEWSDWQAPFTNDGTVIALGEVSHSERRQVVAYKVTATDELPVVDKLDRSRSESYVWIGPHSVCLIDVPNDTAIDVTDEPWAADLTPGRPVWRLHLEALDQPYTRMVAQWGNGSPLHDVVDAAVPLSVPVGEVTELELVP